MISLIQGYAQAIFWMADEDGVTWVVFSRDRTPIPLDERFHYQSRCGVSSIKSCFTVAINRDFKAVVTAC